MPALLFCKYKTHWACFYCQSGQLHQLVRPVLKNNREVVISYLTFWVFREDAMLAWNECDDKGAPVWILRVALYCPPMEDGPPQKAVIDNKSTVVAIHPILRTHNKNVFLIHPWLSTVYKLPTHSLCADKRAGESVHTVFFSVPLPLF